VRGSPGAKSLFHSSTVVGSSQLRDLGENQRLFVSSKSALNPDPLSKKLSAARFIYDFGNELAMEKFIQEVAA
jgi:hypothetical protein